MVRGVEAVRHNPLARSDPRARLGTYEDPRRWPRLSRDARWRLRRRSARPPRAARVPERKRPRGASIAPRGASDAAVRPRHRRGRRGGPHTEEDDGAKKKSSGGDSKNAEARKALTRALESGEPVSGRVEVANRGGLILRIFDGRFRAFLPLSQMASSRTLRVKQSRTAMRTVTAPVASFDDDEEDFIPPPVASVDKPAPAAKGDGQKDATVAALESQVGKSIAVRVTSVGNSKVVVSERALAMERGAGALQPGVRATGHRRLSLRFRRLRGALRG